MLTLTVDCGAPACKGGGIEFKRVPVAQWRSDAVLDDDDLKDWFEDNDEAPPDWYEDEMRKRYRLFCQERGYGMFETRSYEDNDYNALKETWSNELLERETRRDEEADARKKKRLWSAGAPGDWCCWSITEEHRVQPVTKGCRIVAVYNILGRQRTEQEPGMVPPQQGVLPARNTVELAIELIKRGKAYVCHQTKEETAASRQALQGFQLHCSRNGLKKYDTPLPPGAASPFRDRSVEENLQLFDEMSKGVWPEGACCLRMKGDLRSDITSMWDLAAYRVKFEAHPHSGDKYCIYPTYDYTHCLVDSLENITHSLCTLEFETRQAPNGPYYWLLDSLDMYKPVTWEFARCNITYNVMSKRKLNKLVTDGHVHGWDDPRLLTAVTTYCIDTTTPPRLASETTQPQQTSPWLTP